MKKKNFKIIAISGFKGSGKDTLAKLVKEAYEKAEWTQDKPIEKFPQPYVMIHSMAQPIRNVVKDIFHIKETSYVDKEKPLDKWSKRLGKEVSYRDLVNMIGESIKDTVSDKVWVYNAKDALNIFREFVDEKSTVRRIGSEPYGVFIIPDIRYQCEQKMLKQLKKKGYDVEYWIIFKKSALPEWVRKGLDVTVPEDVEIIKKDFQPSKHESEWCFSNPTFDRVFYNDSTIEELNQKVITCVESDLRNFNDRINNKETNMKFLKGNYNNHD